MRKIITSILILLALNSCASGGGKQKDTDLHRIEFINKIASYVDEYKKIKGHYPLADGKYQLPIVVYLNSDIKKVDYPIHYNNVTILDYALLNKELKLVLGDKFEYQNDPVENYNDPEKYISKYYSAGNTYLINGNLSSQAPLANHNVFNKMDDHKFHNKSTISEVIFHPGFMHRYSIGNISNKGQYIFSHPDYLRLKKNGYKFPEPDESLFKAILDKNYDKVTSLLEEGVELNPIHEDFNKVSSPLIFAVRNNDFQMAKILIEAGANVNARGSYQDVVLIYGLNQKAINIELIKLLVDAGANVNEPNFFGISPFIGACLTGNLELVELFLENGANINQDYFYFEKGEYKKGPTPLKAAIQNEHVEVIKILISNNCDIKNGTPGNNKSPLEYAKSLGKEKVVELLKEHQ